MKWPLAATLLLACALAALAPIRSYDFFWHLATGRWIVEHRALPLQDPFALASDRVEWVNGEWLFEVPLYLVGANGAIWLRALLVGAIFALGFYFAVRDGGDPTASLILASLAFAGGAGRLDARPSTAAALLLVLALGLPKLVPLIAAVWINVHPSALLAPLIPAVRKQWLFTALTAAALLVNPWGWRGIAAPLELMSWVGSGAFVNAEWLPSVPTIFPMLYVTMVIGIVLFVWSTPREHLWRFMLFALFAFLAVRHVRNQGLYFAAFPMLIGPMARRTLPRALQLAAIVPIALIALARKPASPFPVEAVARLRATPFKGHVYNPDQFGGFLIWTFYPDRVALTDGRNELYRTFIAEYARARLDSRAWHALLRKHRIDLAVDEYHREQIVVVDAVTHEQHATPASDVYFPRSEWALIADDGVGKVFVRRGAFAAGEIARWELVH